MLHSIKRVNNPVRSNQMAFASMECIYLDGSKHIPSWSRLFSSSVRDDDFEFVNVTKHVLNRVENAHVTIQLFVIIRNILSNFKFPKEMI